MNKYMNGEKQPDTSIIAEFNALLGEKTTYEILTSEGWLENREPYVLKSICIKDRFEDCNCLDCNELNRQKDNKVDLRVIYSVGYNGKIRILWHADDRIDEDIKIIDQEDDSTEEPGIYKGILEWSSSIDRETRIDKGNFVIGKSECLYKIPNDEMLK